MDASGGAEVSERDQLWASLRALRPEIGQLADGGFDNSERQQKLIVLLARIVGAELDYRAREGLPD